MEIVRVARLLSDIESVFRRMREDIVESAGTVAVQRKDDGSEQTALDVRVEQEVFQAVSSEYKDVVFLGEETGYELPLPELACLLDPIDGTKSFVEGTEGYTGMAVVIKKGVAIGSIIYRYIDDASFVAIRGQGAMKNGQSLKLSAVGLPKTLYCRERMIPFVQELPGFERQFVEKGPTGAGHGFALVAEGKIAARINAPHAVGSGGFIHDYAPGTLLVAEAGGRVIPFRDKEYAIDNFSFVACHPDLEPTINAVRSNLASIEVDSLG